MYAPQDLSEKLSNTENLDEKFRIFLDAISNFGIEKYYYAQIHFRDSGDMTGLAWHDTFDKDYLEEFQSLGLHAHDYIVEHCKHHSGFLRWSDMHDLHGTGVLTSGEERTLEFVRDYGLHSGITFAKPRYRNLDGVLFGGISLLPAKGVRKVEFNACFNYHKEDLYMATASLFEHIDPCQISEKHFDLSSREKQVLRLVSEGYQIQQISDTLLISDRTTAHHLAQIRKKLDVKTSAHAVARALRLGVLIA